MTEILNTCKITGGKKSAINKTEICFGTLYTLKKETKFELKTTHSYVFVSKDLIFDMLNNVVMILKKWLISENGQTIYL